MALERSEILSREAEFVARFGKGETPRVYFAPGRVNLLGDHTDYNGGLVLPVATEAGTYLVWRPRDDTRVLIYSHTLDAHSEFDLEDIGRQGDWSDYPRGVTLALKDNGVDVRGWEGYYFGDLHLEAGLSSSASIEMVTALALSEGFNGPSPRALALLSRRAESDFVGIDCGIMDQFASALCEEDSAIMLDCHTTEYEKVRLPKMFSSIMIAHTGVPRKLSDTPYNLRREECREALDLVRKQYVDIEYLSQMDVDRWRDIRDAIPVPHRHRIEHVVFENVRVREAARRARRGDAKGFGSMMEGSHLSLRDLFDVSSPELDTLVDVSLGRPGVWGSRMTGAGFGGCVVSLVDKSYAESYLEEVPVEYRKRTGLDGSFSIIRPGKGMHRVFLDREERGEG